MVVEPSKSNICCIVVSYHPDPQLIDRLRRISPQVDKIILVDNASPDEYHTLLSQCANEPKLELISNQSNAGLAAAINQGASIAAAKGYDWLLTMDQDTIAGESLVEGLIGAYIGCDFRENVAVIGCNYTDRFLGKLFLEEWPEGQDWVEQTTVITAGSLINARVFEELGGLREEFFIDHLDDEFCLRARKNGYRVIMATRSLMEQAPGAPQWHYLFKKRYIAGHMAAFRRYYSTRNHTILIKEYRKLEPEWVNWSIETRIKEIALVLLFEEQKFRKMLNVARGFIDGLRGRLGPKTL